MTSTEPALRRAGRVLVIDPAGRVLLLEGFDPAEPGSPFWFTIGGGLDEGEHSAQAALRELREEAGIVAAGDQLTGPVWRRSTQSRRPSAASAWLSALLAPAGISAARPDAVAGPAAGAAGSP